MCQSELKSYAYTANLPEENKIKSRKAVIYDTKTKNDTSVPLYFA